MCPKFLKMKPWEPSRGFSKKHLKKYLNIFLQIFSPFFGYVNSPGTKKLASVPVHFVLKSSHYFDGRLDLLEGPPEVLMLYNYNSLLLRPLVIISCLHVF